ncbi:hypothetical protein GQ44DRAFT_832595 [Phaeosphaeriaceae sp. PMI808]|nr:hypothetical protein GQ44DRAFT_832595 [Phaeosphaeriaceae sp. PMI808]
MRRWNIEEDNVLRNQVHLYSSCGVPIDWNAVSAALVDRSNKDCRKRWQKIDTRWNSGAWTSAEDHKLHEAVTQSGERWAVVSDFVATRNPDQCAKRWRNALDPNISHEVWTEEAEKQLASAVKSMGRDWKAIAETFFPFRSRQDLSNRFALIQRKNRVRRSYSTSKFQNASPKEKRPQDSDEPWQDNQERPFTEDQSLTAASQVPPASMPDFGFTESCLSFGTAAEDQSLTAPQVLPTSMPDLGFAESCFSFSTDTGSLERCYTNHNDPLNDFAEILQPSQHQQESLSAMHVTPPSSLWSSTVPSAWPSGSESSATQPTTPASQLSSGGRLGNTVMTIENLSPTTRAAIIELVLHDGGSLHIVTK